jgi:transcriptional regulator with XRE-family HTH domain
VSEKLGSRIRAFRRACGISQEELAFKASVSTTYLGQIERAEKSPTVEILDKIATALDVSIYDLFLFDEKIKTGNTCTTLNKINAQLSTLSEEEQAELLKLIKNIKAFKNI